MVKKFYAVFLLDSGKRHVVECRMNEIDERLKEMKAVLQGVGDSREEALAQAENDNPTVGWHSGSDFPMPNAQIQRGQREK